MHRGAGATSGGGQKDQSTQLHRDGLRIVEPPLGSRLWDMISSSLSAIRMVNGVLFVHAQISLSSFSCWYFRRLHCECELEIESREQPASHTSTAHPNYFLLAAVSPHSHGRHVLSGRTVCRSHHDGRFHQHALHNFGAFQRATMRNWMACTWKGDPDEPFMVFGSPKSVSSRGLTVPSVSQQNRRASIEGSRVSKGSQDRSLIMFICRGLLLFLSIVAEAEPSKVPRRKHGPTMRPRCLKPHCCPRRSISSVWA